MVKFSLLKIGELSGFLLRHCRQFSLGGFNPCPIARTDDALFRAEVFERDQLATFKAKALCDWNWADQWTADGLDPRRAPDGNVRPASEVSVMRFVIVTVWNFHHSEELLNGMSELSESLEVPREGYGVLVSVYSKGLSLIHI